jgi:hypothetical protein
MCAARALHPTPPCSSGIQLSDSGNRDALLHTLWMLPIMYLILMVKRLVLTVAFRPLFRAIKGDLVSGHRPSGRNNGSASPSQPWPPH